MNILRIGIDFMIYLLVFLLLYLGDTRDSAALLDAGIGMIWALLIIGILACKADPRAMRSSVRRWGIKGYSFTVGCKFLVCGYLAYLGYIGLSMTFMLVGMLLWADVEEAARYVKARG